MRLFVFTLMLFSATAIPARAGDWPGWRGPTGMGQSAEKNLPLAWGGKDEANVLWKAALLPSDKVRRDQNQSSPIVCGEQVFVTVSYWTEGTSEKEAPEHHLLCFRTTDGKRLWDTKIAPGPWKLSDLRGGYTAPTPACDGRRVVAAFGSAVVAAVGLDGKLAWRYEIKPHLFDVALGASPVFYRDTVLLLCDEQQKASRLLALDSATGGLRWQKDRPTSDWAHSTPALATIAGKTQLLIGTANGPQGVDPSTGGVIWYCKLPAHVGDTVTPVLGGGVVYVDSGRGGSGIALDPTGSGDVTKTHLKWTIKNMPEGFSSPVVVGDLLYRLHGPGVVSCWKLLTGEAVFKERLEGLDPAISPVATADGRIYCAARAKALFCRQAPNLKCWPAMTWGMQAAHPPQSRLESFTSRAAAICFVSAKVVLHKIRKLPCVPSSPCSSAFPPALPPTGGRLPPT